MKYLLKTSTSSEESCIKQDSYLIDVHLVCVLVSSMISMHIEHSRHMVGQAQCCTILYMLLQIYLHAWDKSNSQDAVSLFLKLLIL